MEKNSSDTLSSLNILFVGNSFTARNNMPELLAQLSTARGKKLKHTLISAGGASLRMHWNKGEAQLALSSATFDYVVLQEQSTLPVKNAGRMQENIKLFDAVIKAAGARTVLYMTWSRECEPQNQQLITSAYSEVGSELGALVVPVGSAWENFLAKNSSVKLYDKDGSHPSVAGSYLAACVFYAVLYNESPAGIDFEASGLNKADTKTLQSVAWQTASSRRKTLPSR